MICWNFQELRFVEENKKQSSHFFFKKTGVEQIEKELSLILKSFFIWENFKN